MAHEDAAVGPSGAAATGPGSVIADYRLERQIGQGGMAVVFEARDERLRRRVAVKVMAPAYAADASLRHRFIRESLAAAAVDDPHILPIYQAGESDGILYIAMRFVAGGDVRKLLRDHGRLSPDQAAAIISPVASALDAAHEAGLVHRDVKPANMLMDVRPGRPDHVYLSDFGLVKGALTSVGVSGSDLFLGTPDYCAPEQAQGHAVSSATDQYALACAAFELLAGEPPFRRDRGLAVLFAQVSEPPPALSARRPDLPADADQVLARALAKSPEDRFGSCRQFADALREALRLPPYSTSAPRGEPRIAPSAPSEPEVSEPEVSEPDPTVVSAPGMAASAGNPDAAPGAAPDFGREDGEPTVTQLPPEARRAAQTAHAAATSPRHPAGDGTAPDGPVRAGRRWSPLATILVLVVLVVAGGIFAIYQYAQSRYYVGTSNGHVVIFRGLDHDLLGVSITSVYDPTGIPVSGLPSADRQAITRSSTTSLTRARAFLATLRSDYQRCQYSSAALRHWETHQTRTVFKLVRVHGRIVRKAATLTLPKPKIPAGCPFRPTS